MIRRVALPNWKGGLPQMAYTIGSLARCLDDQQNQLTEAVNRFEAVVQAAADHVAIRHAMDVLESQFRRHFDVETALMAAITYQDATRHANQHRLFLMGFKGLVSVLSADSATLMRFLPVFFRSWIDDHDHEFDDALARTVNGLDADIAAMPAVLADRALTEQAAQTRELMAQRAPELGSDPSEPAPMFCRR